MDAILCFSCGVAGFLFSEGAPLSEAWITFLEFAVIVMGRVASFIAGQKEQSRWIRVCWLPSRKDLVGGRSVIVDFPGSLSTVSFSSSSSSFSEQSIRVYRNRQCSSFVFNYQFLASSLFFLLVSFTSTVHSQDCQYPQKNASRGRPTTERYRECFLFCNITSIAPHLYHRARLTLVPEYISYDTLFTFRS